MGKRWLTVSMVLAVLVVGACGGDDDDAATATTKKAAIDKPVVARTLEIDAVDFAFKAPDTIKGGLVEINYKNKGLEPHFAALAKLNSGHTFDDAKAFFAAPPTDGPPAGPPPFVEYGGMPTADPGFGGSATFNLAAGEYFLFCAIASPDGTPHMAKGMMRALEVTEGKDGNLPDAPAGRFTAADFTIGGLGVVKANLEVGSNVISLHNSGKQLHEVNLVELAAGKTIDDMVAWGASEEGPPPAKFLSGLAIAPEQTVVGPITLGRGKTYAFVCMIPDSIGDGAPHISKGMYTEPFTVE